MSEQFNVDEKKIFVSGLPRNDVFATQNDDLNRLRGSHYSKTIIWMPTFRKFKYSERNDSNINYFLGLPLIHSPQDLNTVNEILKKLNICLIIKFHPGAFEENTDELYFSNIIFLTPTGMKEKGIDDIYKIFNQTDAMISDYSSVVFDYMLLDKPIGFIFDDINEYKLGFCVNDPKEYYSGPYLYNLEDLIQFVTNVSNGIDDYKEKRNRINDFLHEYKDFDNAKRIMDYVFNIL